MSKIIDTTVDENDVANEIKDENEKKDESIIDMAVTWIKNHKIITAAAIVFFPITLIWLGAKLFSTHTIVETEKEVTAPSCTDGFRKVPVHTETITHYDWIPENDNTEE